MCGIWAIVGYHGNTMDLMRNFQKICGRGPDCYRIENINHYNECCLGFHRLSIVGDSDGMQPIRIKSIPHINLICNGEIYNHKLILEDLNVDPTTHSDIECMIHLYERYGVIKMAQQLDGVFGCFILDTKFKKVYLVRDRYGVRPMKFILSNKGFLGACSEAKGLINIIPNIPHQSDIQIQTVMPGTILEFDLLDDSKVGIDYKTHKYATIGDYPLYRALVTPPDLPLATTCPNYEDILQNIRQLLKAAVSKRLQSERRIGCFLSGGLDSSLISGLLVQCMREAGTSYKLQTYSIGMGEDGLDIIAARQVSEFLGTEHFEVHFSLEDALEAIPKVIYRLETFDITTIRASTGMYLLSKYIKENSENIVIFSGEGSDELTGGYIYFHHAPNGKEFHEENLRLLNNLHYFDIRRLDRTVSGWGMEPRTPFLDHWFSNFYLNIDPELRRPQKGIEKYLLRQAFSGHNIIPDEILWRPKEAFSDGVSQKNKKPFFEQLKDHFNILITDEEFAVASNTYPSLTPISKEAYYYRREFETHFPKQVNLTPALWMPRFIKSNDPSARTLAHYKSSETT